MKTRSEKERQQRHLENSSNSSNDEESTDVTSNHHYEQEKTEDSTQKMIRKALGSRTTVMCAFFVLFYVGKYKPKTYTAVLINMVSAI